MGNFLITLFTDIIGAVTGSDNYTLMLTLFLFASGIMLISNIKRLL